MYFYFTLYFNFYSTLFCPALLCRLLFSSLSLRCYAPIKDSRLYGLSCSALLYSALFLFVLLLKIPIKSNMRVQTVKLANAYVCAL